MREEGGGSEGGGSEGEGGGSTISLVGGSFREEGGAWGGERGAATCPAALAGGWAAGERVSLRSLRDHTPLVTLHDSSNPV